MATSPPTITIYDLPTVAQGRRLLHGLTSGVGRVATLTGAATAGVCLAAPALAAGLVAVGTLATTATGVGVLWLARPPGHQRATAAVLYAFPGGSLTAILATELLTAQFGVRGTVATVVEAVATVAWAAVVWLVRPARTARRMDPILPAESATIDEAKTIVVGPDATEGSRPHPAAIRWADTVAIADGAAPDTIVEDIESTGPDSMQAIIRSTIPGKPVPKISIEHLSATMDIPEDLIKITPVPGRGAGVRRLTIGKPPAKTDLKQIWAEQIAPNAMPGAEITEIWVGPMPAAGTGSPE